MKRSVAGQIKGFKMKMYDVDFFTNAYGGKDNLRVTAHIASDNIREDIARIFNDGFVEKRHGDYVYFYPSHTIRYARIKE